MKRTLEPPSTMFSWRQIRHGRNHRRPQTHTEERAWRDEATQPDEQEYYQRMQDEEVAWIVGRQKEEL